MLQMMRINKNQRRTDFFRINLMTLMFTLDMMIIEIQLWIQEMNSYLTCNDDMIDTSLAK